MSTRTTGTVLETVRPWRPFHCRVARLEHLSPSFLRVTFTGEGLDAFADNGYDQRFKLVLPAPDGGFERFPEGDRWYSELRALPTEQQCRVRTYTVRAVRPEAREVDVDMVLHEPVSGAEAPALRWALDAEEGDAIVLFGPDAGFDGPHGGVDFNAPSGAELLIGGDETAAPAIAAILERLPEDARGHVFIEVPHRADELALAAPRGVQVHWLAREGADWGTLLVPAVTVAAGTLDIEARADELAEVDVDTEILWDLPEVAEPAGAYVWIAAEAGVVKALRRVLRKDLGLPKECGAFMGYWRHGKSAD